MTNCTNRITIVAIGCLLWATSTGQQPTAENPDDASRREARVLAAKLSLDSAQQAKIISLFKGLVLARKSNATPADDRSDKIQKAERDYEQSLKKVLTKAQYKNYLDWVDQRSKRYMLLRMQKDSSRVKLKAGD